MINSILDEIVIMIDMITGALKDFCFVAIISFFITTCKIGCWINERYDKNAPTEIFKIKEEIFEESNSKRESFVISNPPKDSLQLKKLVEAYNFKTLPADTIKKYRDHKREFYRETQCLTRDYEEGKPYPKLRGWARLCGACEWEHNGDDFGQQIRYHFYSRDFLMDTYYFYMPPHSGGYWDYSYGIR